MATTTLASTAPRTLAVASSAPARRPLPVAHAQLPNVAGQIGPVGIKSGIVNAGLKGARK